MSVEFLFFSSVVFLILALLVPKNLPKCEIYVVALFSIALGFLMDITFDLKYNIYGYFSPGVQYAGFLPFLIIFPSTGVLFLNFYPLKKSLRLRFFYILCWTVFSLIFEYLSTLSGYFYHNGWKYWYSVIGDPILFFLQLLQLKLFKKYSRK